MMTTTTMMMMKMMMIMMTMIVMMMMMTMTMIKVMLELTPDRTNQGNTVMMTLQQLQGVQLQSDIVS